MQCSDLCEKQVHHAEVHSRGLSSLPRGLTFSLHSTGLVVIPDVVSGFVNITSWFCGQSCLKLNHVVVSWELLMQWMTRAMVMSLEKLSGGNWQTAKTVRCVNDSFTRVLPTLNRMGDRVNWWFIKLVRPLMYQLFLCHCDRTTNSFVNLTCFNFTIRNYHFQKLFKKYQIVQFNKKPLLIIITFPSNT